MNKKFIIIGILVIFIISLLLFVYKLINPKDKEVLKEGNYIEATFLAFEIRPEVAEAIRIGDIIYDEMGRKSLVVKSVEVKPAFVFYPNSNGIVVSSEHPFLKDVYVTARSLAPKFSWTYIYGRDKIMAGAQVAIYGENWKVWTKIIKVIETK